MRRQRAMQATPLEWSTGRRLQQLIELLGDSDFRVAQAAAAALSVRGEAAIEALIVGLHHSNWRVRKHCAGLLDHLADDRSIEPLCQALRDPIEGVRRLAIHSLGCQPCKLAPLSVDIVG